MDMKQMRERYYDKWINYQVQFKGVDGYTYIGTLEDWYEDGTLVLAGLTVTNERIVRDIPPNADRRDYIKDPHHDQYYESINVDTYDDFWVLFDSDGILFFISDQLGSDSDKMTPEHRGKREAHWEQERTRRKSTTMV